MENATTRMQHLGFVLSGFWERVPIAVRSIVTGFLVAEIGITIWMASLIFVPGIWPLVIMGCVLCAFCAYFSGSWWHKPTAEIRRERFRAVKLQKAVWMWGLAAAMLLVVVAQSSFVLTFRIIEFPAELFTQGYGFDDAPLWAAWMFILMSSLVAGICEEIGFRGYMQVPLEKRYGPGVAIAITSLMFLILHLNQAWAPPVLLHIFALGALFGLLAYASGSLFPSIVAHVVMDVFSFAYWWTDVAGKFDMRTIAKVGIDTHFVAWSLILGTSLALFLWVTRKTNATRQWLKD